MGKHPAVKEREVAIKCNLCWDRLRDGKAEEKIPACAKACPTGALEWGKKNDVAEVAGMRIGSLKGSLGQEVGGRQYRLYGKDVDANLGGLGVFFILEDQNVSEYRRLPNIPRVPPSVSSWKGFFRWSAAIVPGLVVVFAFLHYLIFGPLGVHVVEEEEEKAWDDMTSEEQEKLLERREREVKAKRRAGKAMRLYQPMPTRRGKRGGKSGKGPTRRRRK
jgi:formate dehydrogenase iron-sulfur subunit